MGLALRIDDVWYQCGSGISMRLQAYSSSVAAVFEIQWSQSQRAVAGAFELWASVASQRFIL